MAKPSQENFYKKLRYFAGINESSTKESNQGAQGTLIDVAKSNDGTSYGIVKENHHYYIKKSTLKEGHKASDFIYISGLQNKMDYQYDSIAEAKKQRNFVVQGLNEAFSLQPKRVVSSEKKIEKIDNPFQYIKETVNKGKSANKVTLENRFKKNISETTIEAKKGLMTETATQAIRKAMGLVTEDKAISTEDSEVKEGDVLPDKTGKEKPQAPINDGNAQTKANQAMGKGSFQGKLASGGSITVNQQSDKLKEEASPLVTDDSELIVNQSLANQDSAAKEKPQAPINDANAKTEADKAVGKAAAGGTSLPNDAEESDETDPFDDKEDAGDETGDIVTEAKDLSTDDSEQKKSDEIANSKSKVGTPEAPYNSYNQPTKGQKETKGTALAAKAVVKEEADLSTADSEANPKDSIANKATAPSSSTPSLIVADSELNPDQTLANDTKTNLPGPVAEGDDSLVYADSPINAPSSLPNEENGNVSYDAGNTQPDASYSMDDNAIAEAGEEEALDAASAALGDLDVQIDTEKEAPVAPVAPEGDPMAGGEEMPVEDPMAGVAPEGDIDAAAAGMEDLGLDGSEEMPVEDPMAGGEEMPVEDPMAGEGDPMGGEGVPAEGGGNTEEAKREAQSKAGEIGELVRDTELAADADSAVEIINQVIEPFNTEEMGHGIQQKIMNKVKGEEDDMGGEPAPEGGELPVPEPDVPAIPESECSECGEFKQYAESRGYPNFNGASIAEVANVVNGYVEAFNEGLNDGDFKGIAPYLTEGVRKELMEYGNRPYLVEAVSKKKLLSEAGVSFGTVEDNLPPTDGNVELTEEEINELGWRDIKNAASGIGRAGSYVGDKVGQQVGKAQQGVMNKVQQAGQFVGDKAKQAGQAVKGELGRMGQDVKQAAQGVKQQYHQGNAKSIIQNIQQDAAKLGKTIANYNAQAQKAGGQPVTVRSIASTIANQLQSGGNVNLGGHKGLNQFGEQIGEGGEDFSQDLGVNKGDFQTLPNDDMKHATNAPQKEMGFAPTGQNLGVSRGKLGESEEKLRKYVQRRLEEKKGNKKPLMNEGQKSEKIKQLDKMIDEQWALANRLK